jgi:hypothetical protein
VLEAFWWWIEKERGGEPVSYLALGMRSVFQGSNSQPHSAFEVLSHIEYITQFLM